MCGSVNLDLLLDVAAAPSAGETVLAASMQEGLGGKGANQAVAAAVLGQDTGLVASVGPDGDRALADLRSSGVGVDGVRVVEEGTGRAIVLLEPSGENRIVVVPGANAHARPPSPDELDGVGAVLCQLETPLDVVHETLRVARSAGLTTVLNAAPVGPGARDLLPLVDVLVVNEGEAAQLSGDDDVAVAVSVLHRAGPVTVVVTLGGRGAYLSSGQRPVHQPVFGVDVVDTTGAGDCFVGALVHRLLHGDDPAAAVRFACAAGALATTRRGAAAAMPTAAAVAALLARA